MALLSSVSADEFTPDDTAVWQMEETDWRDVQVDDVNAPLMLWRADLVAWACCTSGPSDTSRIGDRVKNIRNKA